MSHKKFVCIISPYATTSRTTDSELQTNIKYASLLTSIAKLVPGVEPYCPTLQDSALPESFVDNPVFRKDLIYQHCRENVSNESYGWRDSSGLQYNANEIWFGADCGLVPPKGFKNLNVSIKNIHLCTSNQEVIDFIQNLTENIHYDHDTIDLASTAIESQKNGNIKFIKL